MCVLLVLLSVKALKVSCWEYTILCFVLSSLTQSKEHTSSGCS